VSSVDSFRDYAIYQPGYAIRLRRCLLAHIPRDKKKMLNRVHRIRGQSESMEHAIEREADCSDILHAISACCGAINSLMAKVLDGHIRFHVVDPDQNPRSEKARATQELVPEMNLRRSVSWQSLI